LNPPPFFVFVVVVAVVVVLVVLLMVLSLKVRNYDALQPLYSLRVITKKINKKIHG
jgi:hypothetical protein